ncbi:MAG: hypothetical protein M1480_17620, partial [Bacteroidetes bacterium]|nr:hypothetical protein [Bacteroidota bacterium]
WIWCLEDDIYLTAECLSQLISHREKRLLIPLRLNSTGKVNDFTAIIYDLHTPFHKEVRRGTVNSVFTSGYKSPEMHEVQEFTFEGLLINRTIVQEIGLPKRDLFIFGDDTEYALRIRYKLGEKIFLVPKARVIRKINETLRTRYEWRDFYLERNTQYCILAYGENSKFKIVQLLVRNILFSYRCLVKASGKNKFCFPVVVLYDIIKNRNHFPQRFLPPTNKLSK